MANQKTPEERSEIISKLHSKARKGYKTKTTRKRSVSGEELEIIKDQLVALKVIGGYSNTQCAMIVGLSKGQVREIIADPNMRSRIEAVKKNLPKAALNLGQAYLVEAVQAVVHILRTETDNALVLKAAAEIFDRFGIPKVSRSEAKIDTPNDGDESEIPNTLMSKLRAAPPEVQEQVAALQESFTEGVERILSGGTDGPTD